MAWSKVRDVSLWVAALVAAALAGLAACSPAPRSMAACEDPRASDPARIDACTGAIREGAAGDVLAAAYRSRGAAYAGVGDNARAVQDLSQAIRLSPDDADAYASRATAREGLGDLAGMRDDDGEVVRIRPNAVAYVSRSIADDALHDYDAAIVDAARAIELKPDWANGWSARGYAYLGKGEYEVALADFSSALRLSPQFMAAVDGRAAAFRAKHDYDAALAVCTDAIRTDPTNLLAFGCRADTYDAEGDYADALADYDHAIGQDAQQAWLYLGRSSVRLDAGDGPGAIADADQALALGPKDPTALNNACWVRAVRNVALPGALADCQHSLALRPHDAATLDSLAMVYFRMGRLPEARASYDAALAADATLTQSRFMRGVVKRRLGDAAGAAADLAAAEHADPNILKEYAKYGVTP
jgi:tetratricopeptide (TPR) repeat protein